MRLLKLDFDKNRVYGLDILRAIAILFVVIEHGGNFFPESISNTQKSFLLDGVSIFFVLSGFLIGKILLQTLEKEQLSSKTLLNFWKRRWFRTLPNYFLILILLYVFSLFSIIQKPGQIFKYVLFIQNFHTQHPSFFPEAWSLSIEEWFYIIAPIITFSSILLFKTNTKKAILIACCSILFLSVISRYYTYSTMTHADFYEWDEVFRKQVIMRLDSIMFGVLASYIYYYHEFIWNKYKTSCFVLGILLIVIQKIYSSCTDFNLNPYNYIYSFSIYALAFAMLLPLLNNLKTGTGVIFKTLSGISIISYSMYLLNLSVVQLSIIENINWFSLTGIYLVIIKYIFYWAFTIIGSIVLYKYYELPFMKLRDNI